MYVEKQKLQSNQKNNVFHEHCSQQKIAIQLMNDIVKNTCLWDCNHQKTKNKKQTNTNCI